MNSEQFQNYHAEMELNCAIKPEVFEHIFHHISDWLSSNGDSSDSLQDEYDFIIERFVNTGW